MHKSCTNIYIIYVCITMADSCSASGAERSKEIKSKNGKSCTHKYVHNILMLMMSSAQTAVCSARGAEKLKRSKWWRHKRVMKYQTMWAQTMMTLRKKRYLHHDSTIQPADDYCYHKSIYTFGISKGNITMHIHTCELCTDFHKHGTAGHLGTGDWRDRVSVTG